MSTPREAARSRFVDSRLERLWATVSTASKAGCPCASRKLRQRMSIVLTSIRSLRDSWSMS
eukprot:5822040-Pleurochrysis_carterae.AAC.2